MVKVLPPFTHPAPGSEGIVFCAKVTAKIPSAIRKMDEAENLRKERVMNEIQKAQTAKEEMFKNSRPQRQNFEQPTLNF